VAREPVVGVKALHPNLGLRQSLKKPVQRPEPDALLRGHEQTDAEGVLDRDIGLVQRGLEALERVRLRDIYAVALQILGIEGIEAAQHPIHRFRGCVARDAVAALLDHACEVAHSEVKVTHMLHGVHAGYDVVGSAIIGKGLYVSLEKFDAVGDTGLLGSCPRGLEHFGVDIEGMDAATLAREVAREPGLAAGGIENKP
jgi:hypothetical protein